MKVPALVFFAVLASSSVAQHHRHAVGMAAEPAPGPYAGLESRDIKALSEQQIDDLRAGRGMSLALAAELNGYPGPSHVLQLAERLNLTAAQRQRTHRLFEQMEQQAKELGVRIIAAETQLDRQFRHKTAQARSVEESSAKIARLQGRLRAAHLKFHLAMMELLDPEQVAQYHRLRGYADDALPH